MLLFFCILGNKIILRARSGSVVNLNEIVPIKGFDLDLTNAKYDCSKNTFAISAILKSTTTIIPNFMVVSQVAIAVEADLTDIAKTLSTTLQGVWAVGKLKIDVTLTYSRSSGATSVTATPASGTKIKSFIKNVLGISLPVSPTVNLAFIFRGDIFRDGFTTLSVTYDKGDNNYYGIYQKRGDSAKSAKGIATDIQHIQLSKAIKNVINIDISGAPYFGSLSVSNLDLTYATELITNLNQGALGESSLLQKLGYQIEEGLTAYVNVPFHSDALILTYRSKTLSLTTPERNLRLDNLLSYLISGDSDWKSKLPSQLSGIFSINIESITVMADKLAVNLAYPGELVFAEGILSISDVKVETVVAKSSPKATANVFGVIKIGGINFNTQLVQNDEGKYVLTASAGTLKISSYIDSLQAAVLPDSISKFLSKIPFLNFDLQNPKMSYTYGVTPLEVQLGGTPVIQGFTVANLECLVVKSTGVGSKTNVILGFQLGKLDLASLLEKVTTFDFGGVFPLLKQTVDAIVTISPITSTTTHFTIGELASMPVTAGVSVTASMVFPKDCSSKDYFCIYAGRLIGSDVALNIKATFSSSGSFPLFASIGNLKIDKLTLQRAGLEIIGGKSSQIGLVGQVQLEKPPLLFTAGISAGTNGLTLRLSVAGCWIKAFDVEWLTLCKFIGSISFAPPTGITGLSLGAEIHLGYPDSGHQLKAQGYMGVSIINPLENYYYVSFTKLTMGPLLQAFNIRFTLPKPLADSGFPQGFSSSFSVSGQEIQDLGVIIPAGYRINGTINILGLQATADIVIDLPNKIDISVALPPINVGNLLTMYASKTDKNNGPFLKAEVQLLPNQNVDIEAQGYLNVLGISLEAMLKITNTEYEYSVRGKVFSLFQARMTVKASYGSIKSASFQVKGEFELDLFKTIEQVCQQLFKSQGNEAKTAFNEAKSEVDKYVRLQKQARQTFDKAKNALNNAKKGIFMAKVMKSCSSRRCMNVANQGMQFY